MNIQLKCTLAIISVLLPCYLLQAQTWQDYYNKGRTAVEKGTYKEAIPVLLKARMMVADKMDNKNETYRTIVSKLASAYYLSGAFDDAAVNFRDLERAFKEDRATNTKEYADMLEDLAKSYEADKKIPKAASYFQQALTAREKIQGPGHKDYYETMINFGALCMKVRKYDLAGNFYEKLYEFGKTGYKSEPGKYNDIIKNYADLHFYTHKYPKSIELYDEHIKKSIAAKATKDTYVYSIKHKAKAYEKLDKKEDMINNFKKYLTLFKEVSKDKKKEYNKELNETIDLFKSEQEYLAAIDLLKLKLQNFEENSLEKAMVLNEIGRNYNLAKKYAEAKKSFDESISMLKGLGKENDPAYPATLDELGRLQFAQKNYNEAEKTYKEAQEIRIKSLGESHIDYSKGLDSLASFYITQENYSEADTLLTKAIALKKEHLGTDHSGYGHSLYLLAKLKAKLEAYEEAEKLMNSSTSVIAKYFGRGSLEYANSTKEMADLFKTQEKYPQAIKLYRQSLSIYEGIGKAKSKIYTDEIHKSIKEVNEAQE